MAEGEAEWELCKENIQPLRQGRAISVLHQALSQQQEGSSYTVIQQTRQAFESELRTYSGDDPLDVWDRYIKWTLQTYPQGGKESNLSVLLERAVIQFSQEKKYHNDVRYISLWIKFAENSTDPMDFYTYMNGQGIGIMQAIFYIAWSEEYEKRGDLKRADTIFQNGIQCGAEPRDKLQQYHKAFQARASRQAMLNMTSGEPEQSPEPAEPQRSSLANLKHKGKKKAIAPIVRTGASVRHHTRGLSLDLAGASHHAPNSQVMVFDENQPSATVSFEAKPEPWLAPPPARAKENELKAEKWTDVRMPQKSRSGHSVVAPPSRPNFQPFVEESDQLPAVTPCKINPAVNTVLSARKPQKEWNPLERMQEQQQQQAPAQQQRMYCHELVCAGTTEFSFEELRAESYQKKQARDLDEKSAELRRLKEELQRQFSEKERLFLARDAAETDVMQHVEHSQPGPSAVSLGSAAGFKLFDETTGDSSGICPLKASGDFDSADSAPKLETIPTNEVESKALPFSVFDESVACEQPPEVICPLKASGDIDSADSAPKVQMTPTNEVESKALPFPVFESVACEQPLEVAPMVVCQPSVRKPLSAVLKPQEDVLAARPPSGNDCWEGIEPLSEDAIIGGYRNNTLCHVPEDTCDFARAAQLASTPFSGGLSHWASLRMQSGLAEDLSPADPSALHDIPTFTTVQEVFEGTLSMKKLSPIQEERSGEGSYSGSSVSSLNGASCVRANSLSKLELGCSEGVQNNDSTASETEIEDPTSRRMRQQTLEKIDLSSFPNFHKKAEPLPAVNGDEVLAGDEAFLNLSGIISNENYRVYFGQTNGCANVVVKVDLHPIPWDFYIKTQLRDRLGSDCNKYFNDQSSCFLYEDGCITVSFGHYQGTLHEFLAESPLQENVVALLVIELLELVRQMHSCHVVHGDLRPDTLLRRDESSSEGPDSTLMVLDFSHSVDLDLQPEVTSVLGHPGAQAFLRQGVLSNNSSPYQMDLLGIAETVHLMLEKRSMQLVCNNSKWELAEDLEVASENPEVWRNFFCMILNPGTQSTVSVLSELQKLLENHFSCSFMNAELLFMHE